MIMVAMAAVIVVVVVMVKGLARVAATINMVVLVEALFIGVLADVAIALEFVVRAPYFVYVLSDRVVGALVADLITGFVSDMGVGMLADATVNVFASLMAALAFAVPKPLGEFRC